MIDKLRLLDNYDSFTKERIVNIIKPTLDNSKVSIWLATNMNEKWINENLVVPQVIVNNLENNPAVTSQQKYLLSQQYPRSFKLRNLESDFLEENPLAPNLQPVAPQLGPAP